jgi:hypothetical protein
MGNGWLLLTAMGIFMYLTLRCKGMRQFGTFPLVLQTPFFFVTAVDVNAICLIVCHHKFSPYICRQHWFVSRMNGGSVTSGGFCPKNNTLVVTTSKNEVYVFDVEAKQLGEWSKRYTHQLPRSFQEFPGEVIGLSFPLQSSSSVVVYSTR